MEVCGNVDDMYYLDKVWDKFWYKFNHIEKVLSLCGVLFVNNFDKN